MQSTKQYNLEERTLLYGKRIIHLVKALPKNTVNFALIGQVLRSGTSMGANYREAKETETKKRFLFQNQDLQKRRQRNNLLA